jgi:DnaJ-class molecular chaperone
MTPTALALDLDLGFERPSILGGSRQDGPSSHGHAPHEARASDHRPTLDDVVVGVWEGLSSHHTVTCPVCSGKMAPRYGSGARPVGGRCQRCGSTLG